MSIPQNKYEFSFTARMNIIYHENMEAYYSGFINWTAFISVILSSAAFAAIGNILPAYVPKDILIALLAFAVVILNGAVLAFGMLQSMTVHTDLKKKWIDFLGFVQSEAEAVKISEKFYLLNSSEPAQNEKKLKAAYGKATKSMGAVS